MLDFEVQRCTRHCAASGRELQPGETIYSVLVSEGSKLVRQDYSAEGWPGPPEPNFGWWKSQLPSVTPKRAQWAPNDVMLDLLEQTAEDPTRFDFRYVLSLLLVRRRVVRLEETKTDETGAETALLYCPRRECTYHVLTVVPDEARAVEIQEEIGRLLLTFPKAS